MLEEAVLYLLEKVGYRTIDSHAFELKKESGIRSGHSGLEVQGRGTWHQLDALASFEYSPAFMYPLRLIVEAKCYRNNRPVGVEVIRNAVGVLKDISENYFTVSSQSGAKVQVPRFNYHSAVFSTSGFTSGAVHFALAHQVFLIQYKNVPVIQPLIDAIKNFDEWCITRLGKRKISEVRKIYRKALRDRDYDNHTLELITMEGRNHIEDSMVQTVQRVRGSYFGMLQGRWPLHLLTETPLPSGAFESDNVKCRVTGYANGEWKFTPIDFQRDQSNWFELQFNLPDEVAILVSENWEDREAVVNMKQQYFSYIDLTGIIGGIRRNVRLELDPEWIEQYLTRVRRS